MCGFKSREASCESENEGVGRFHGLLANIHWEYLSGFLRLMSLMPCSLVIYLFFLDVTKEGSEIDVGRAFTGIKHEIIEVYILDGLSRTDL